MSTIQTMRALLLKDCNTAFIEAEVPRPIAGKGQVLVRVAANGVNPIDYKIRTGAAPYAMPELPAILGTDLAGVVEAVGEGAIWTDRRRARPSWLACLVCSGGCRFARHQAEEP